MDGQEGAGLISEAGEINVGLRIGICHCGVVGVGRGWMVFPGLECVVGGLRRWGSRWIVQRFVFAFIARSPWWFAVGLGISGGTGKGEIMWQWGDTYMNYLIPIRITFS